MRTKTEAKRQEILDAARIEFSERGFHETTLDHVVRRIGTSKATIYNYFPTKEAMFGEMLAGAARPGAAALQAILSGDQPFEVRLREFARCSLQMQTSKVSISIQRLLIGDADRLRATTLALHNDPEINGKHHLENMLKTEQAAGNLREGDCALMARHLGALLYGDLVARLLLCERDAFSDEERDAAADAAIAMFFAAYGTH